MPPQQIDFDPSVDYYKTLGVSEKATTDEIKRAYRKLAKENHPDSTGGDKAKEARFKRISSAYDVLGDEKKRALYDQIRAGGGRSPFGGGRGGVYTTHGAGPGIFDLGDLFSQFFGGAAGGRRTVNIDFDDGPSVRRGARSGRGEDVELESRVKASDGTWLDVKGNDVYSDVRISFDRAILGTVATVATIDGKAEVKVPPGTSSGKKLRLRGKGVPDRSGRPGDHYVTVQIDVPSGLDEEGQKLLVQLVTRIRRSKASGSGGHND
jgi:DnaJ-class molecular chaperone